jgi:WD40 repeat protein
MHPFNSNSGRVTSVAFSPDDRFALSGSIDYPPRLWEVASGKERRRFEHPGGVTCVAFSPDGSQVYAAGGQHVSAWDLENGKRIERIVRPWPSLTVAASPDGRTLLIGGYGVLGQAAPPVILWSLETGQEIRRFAGRGNPGNSPHHVVYSPDGGFALVGGWDGNVRLWELEKDPGQQPREYAGIARGVTSVAYAPDGKSVAASASDGKVIVWDAETARILQEWQMPGAVHAIAFDARSRHLATANANGTVFFLRLAGTSDE